jgi:hydrogenase nickel incorporation protein HypA/HybF
VHELSIAEALMEQVEEAVSRAGRVGPVKRVDVVVGRLSGVHCDSLRFAFEVLSPGTIVEGAELEITESRALTHCRQCGTSREIDELVIVCPVCGSYDISIDSGRDLTLQVIETAD